MVEPEINHDLLQLSLAQYGPQKPSLRGLLDNGPGTLALQFFQLRGRLKPAGGAERSVELSELNCVVAKGIEGSNSPTQFERFGDRTRVELLGYIAFNPDRLDTTDIFERRSKGEPIQDMYSLAVGYRFGAGSLQHRQAEKQARYDRNLGIPGKHEIK
jgi:hypothetical protein